MMDFSWSDSQIQLRDRVRAFAESELNHGLSDRDAQHTFNADGWRRCGEQGVLGLSVPTEFGGGGLDAISTAGALEAFGYGSHDNGLNFAIGAHLLGSVMPIVTFGSPSQKAGYLPQLCSGASIGALAVSELSAGSDALSTQTTATRRGDDYVLEGRKIFVTNGAVADIFLVLAVVKPAFGVHGLGAFIVEGNTPGLSVTPPVSKMGLHTAAMSEIQLEHCVVPAENLLGSEGSGMAFFGQAMLWERGLILATAVGAMERQIAQTVRHVQTRRQFDRPIGQFQLVASRLVDMRQRWELAQLLLYKMAWLIDSSAQAYDTAALTKLTISESWVANCQDAQRVHGGHGYLSAAGIERDIRDSLGSRFYSGTSEIQRDVIARWMEIS